MRLEQKSKLDLNFALLLPLVEPVVKKTMNFTTLQTTLLNTPYTYIPFARNQSVCAAAHYRVAPSK